jgi:hypothetical protein
MSEFAPPPATNEKSHAPVVDKPRGMGKGSSMASAIITSALIGIGSILLVIIVICGTNSL